jgi:TipAS antibiotic-recognition domain
MRARRLTLTQRQSVEYIAMSPQTHQIGDVARMAGVLNRREQLLERMHGTQAMIRQMIDRWFYPCSPRMHTALADLYEVDQRFAHNIDRYAAGLTPFWSAAIRANAARLSADRPGAPRG